MNNVAKLDDAFLSYACDILANTDLGFSGAKIVEYCNAYAIDFNRVTPHGSYPFDAPKENLKVFSAAEQFRIIKELCERSAPGNAERTTELKLRLYSRYGNLAGEKISKTELIQKTKHWLANYPAALKEYESALSKYEGGIFERNTLDDMRLSFELLVKDLMGNNKSLENQIGDIGTMLKKAGSSAELRNMVPQVIKYYTDFQNNHVKHTDAVNGDELEYVIELTSVIMKFLVKMSDAKP